MKLPDQIDDDLLHILGRPNFWCGPLAHVMRAAGHDIPRRAEDEQAQVLFKLLSFYAEHGAEWRRYAGEWITEIKHAAASRATDA